MSADAQPRREPVIDERIAARRAAVSQERRRRIRRRAASVGLLVALAAGAVGVASSPLFAISGIDVAGVPAPRQLEVRDVLGFVEGDNLLRADMSAAQAAAEALPWVATAEVVRTLPATVYVRVVTRTPFAIVRLANSSWVVDEQGVLLGGGVADDAIVVDALSAELPPPGGQVEDEAVLAALAFHAGLSDEVAGMVVRYRADDARDLRVELAPPEAAQSVWVRVGTAEQPGLKGDVVLAMLAHSRDLLDGEGPGVQELDVRAPQNPVLVPQSDS